MGVLLFQDLAVVPLLVLIPALGAAGRRARRRDRRRARQGGGRAGAAALRRPAR